MAYPCEQRWRDSHKEQIRERQNAYSKQYRETHPESHRIGSQKWKKENPEKYKAQQLALRHCPLGSCCEKCGSTENLERHHPDYSKPLEIVTLCAKCHMKRKRMDSQ